jgi:hypothetical protein
MVGITDYTKRYGFLKKSSMIWSGSRCIFFQDFFGGKGMLLCFYISRKQACGQGRPYVSAHGQESQDLRKLR